MASSIDHDLERTEQEPGAPESADRRASVPSDTPPAGNARRRRHVAPAAMSDSIGMYLNEIGKVPLLTAAEEKELSRAIEAGREAQKAIDSGKRGRQHHEGVC